MVLHLRTLLYNQINEKFNSLGVLIGCVLKQTGHHILMPSCFRKYIIEYNKIHISSSLIGSHYKFEIL